MCVVGRVEPGACLELVWYGSSTGCNPIVHTRSGTVFYRPNRDAIYIESITVTSLAAAVEVIVHTLYPLCSTNVFLLLFLAT